MASVISGTGAASGIDYDTLISGLVSAESGTLNNLKTQQSDYNSKISAYGTLSSALTTFQTAVAKLSTQSSFNSLLAKASDTSVFSATATSSATLGTYSIKVNQLAQQQKLASSGFASTTSTVGTGTLTISFGTYDSGANTFTANSTSPVSINITSANNTLSGIRDAINAANGGVTATIVNDGSTNRLVVTSTASGASNTLKIDVTDGDGNNTDTSGLSQLAYNPTATVGAGNNMTEMQAAKNALLEIDGIAVTKASNTITDAISGVTLNLAKVSASSTTLTVSKDTSTVQSNVQAFVDAYNTLDTTIRNLTKFVDIDSASNGVLLGDSTARDIATQLRTALTKAVTGAGSFTTLSDIGVSFQSTGKLALDTTKLATAMDTSFSDIASLFAAGGKATDSLVSITGSTSKTKEGTYAVNVTQLATQGTLLGSSGPNLTVTAGTNDALEFSINGKNYAVTLAAGTYSSATTLASELQSRLVSAGANVTVSVEGGILKITTNAYGSSESASVTGGNGANDLFGSSPTATAGLNVAGTINGVAATGSGQSLVGATGNDSEGLIVKIIGGTTGNRGTVTYNQGYAYKLNEIAKDVLSSTGSIQTRTDGLNASIDRIEDRIDQQNRRLDQIEARYRAQFAALETLISSMQTTSSYISQQIAQFNSNN